MAEAFFCRGLVAAAHKEWRAASDSYAAGLQIFEALDQPYDVARTLEALAEATDALHATSDAVVLRRRAAQVFARLGASRPAH